MKWSDEQRAQLLQLYKEQMDKLGEEEFFARFDEIREEAHNTIEGESMITPEFYTYLDEWLADVYNNEKYNPHSVYQIASGIYSLVFREKASIKRFARVWLGEEPDQPSTYTPHDNRPYAIDCTDGKGLRQSHLAEGYIVSPTGRRIGAMCQACAQAVIDEYQEKLGETWTFEAQDWRPIPTDREVEGRGLHQLAELGTQTGFRLPEPMTVQSAGRLGGKAKSEAKTLSSRSNGKKGGRPKKYNQPLDLEEI